MPAVHDALDDKHAWCEPFIDIGLAFFAVDDGDEPFVDENRSAMSAGQSEIPLGS
jgi:hypothetical protein